MFQFHERWIGYRSTAEALQRERHLYQTRPGACPGEGRGRLLAERVEELVTCETVGSEQARGRVPGAPR